MAFGEIQGGDQQVLNKLCNTVKDDNSIFVELGTYLGTSCQVICNSVCDKNNVQVHSVDHYKISGGQDIVGNIEISKKKMSKFNFVTFYDMDSTESAKLFDDKSLSLVFIDADHTYQKSKDDILAFLPKIKPGGIICGHDYDRKWKNTTQRMLDKLKENILKVNDESDVHDIPLTHVDGIVDGYRLDEWDVGDKAPYPRICLHGGIALAVHEVFNEDFNWLHPYQSTIWWKQV